MTLDEKIVEAVGCAIFHAKPRNRIWDALPNEFKNQYRKHARAAITAYQAEAWQDISTAPKDGREILIADDQWSGAGFYHDGAGCKRSDGGWFCEEDRNNLLIARDVPAKFWQPLPPPPVGSGRNLADANSKSPIQAREE